jgi:RNA polymerase sigma-70 factor, ECF subfamily
VPELEPVQQPVSPVATLGDVLYPDNTRERVSEDDWVQLVRCIAAGDQLALHALYQRAHRLVFTLALRITASRETAEEVTVDVFHDVWRRAGSYDPENGTVLGWIMNQARSRALDRLRFQQRRKRVDPDRSDPHDEPTASVDALESKQQSEKLLQAVGTLSVGERQAIEAAYFSELTHAEVALRLNEPLGTVKTRIRSALQKLRLALGGEGIPR